MHVIWNTASDKKCSYMAIVELDRGKCLILVLVLIKLMTANELYLSIAISAVLCSSRE